MHILTKILVVAASLFSVMLAALTMAYAGNTDTIRRSFEAEQRARDVAERTLGVQSTQLQSEIARLREQNTQLASTIATLEEGVNRAGETAANAKAAETRLSLQMDSMRGQVEQALEMQTTQLKMIDAYRAEVTNLRNAELDFKGREIDLISIISDLQGRNEVQEETIRSLKEQLHTIQTAGASPTGSASGEAGVLSTPMIYGSVLESFADSGTGDTLVRIDVGRNDGVRAGMKFAIVRDNGAFMCNLIVTRVDLQDSLGRVETLGQTDVQVRAGLRIQSVRQ